MLFIDMAGHYILDPIFRDDSEKTKYFAFRGRFNLVAGVLKVSGIDIVSRSR